VQHVLQVGQSVGGRAARLDVGLARRLTVDPVEVLVDRVEHLGLVGQLLADVAADEDALEVHPLALHVHPRFQHLVTINTRTSVLNLIHQGDSSDVASGCRYYTVSQKKQDTKLFP